MSFESLWVHSPRLAAALAFRRTPESRKKETGCRIKSGMTKYVRYPVACCGVVHWQHVDRKSLKLVTGRTVMHYSKDALVQQTLTEYLERELGRDPDRGVV